MIENPLIEFLLSFPALCPAFYQLTPRGDLQLKRCFTVSMMSRRKSVEDLSPRPRT